MTKSKTPSLGEVVESFLDVRRARYSPTTVMNDGFVLRRFAREVGDPPADRLTPEQVDAWFRSLLGEHVDMHGMTRPPVGASTCNYYRTRVLSLTRWASKKALLREDLLTDVPIMVEPRRDRLRPSKAVLAQMLDIEDLRDRLVLALGMNLALRTSEIRGLRVGDVSLAAGTLRVWVSKSKIEDRMPLPPPLDRAVREWLIKYAQDLGRPLVDGDFLIPSVVGPRYYYDRDNVRRHTTRSWNPARPAHRLERVVQEALARCGQPTRGQGLHTLRRAASRAFFDAMSENTGYDSALRTTSALLHHATAAVTETYLGLTAERARRDEFLRNGGFLDPEPTDNVTLLRRAT